MKQSDNKHIPSNEVCNANIVKVTSMPKSSIQLIQLERIAIWFFEQPIYIAVKKQGQDEFISFEQVARFRVWVPNKSVYSWIIYSEEREFEISLGCLTQDIIIRHGFWDRYADASLLMAQKKSGQDGPDWPNLKLYNTYVAKSKTLALGQYLKKLDTLVGEGICLKPRETTQKTDWDQFEIMRLFNWGQVHAWISPKMESQGIEELFWEMEKELNRIASQPDLDPVEEMQLKYGYPPDLVKLLE